MYKVESPAKMVKTGTILGKSAIYPLSLLEIRSHKQRLHTKDDVRRDKPINPQFPAHMVTVKSRVF